MSKYDVPMDTSENSSTGKIIRMMKPGSCILEFGCAEGRMTQYMKENMNCKVYVVEINEEAFQKAKVYAEGAICCDANTLEWKEAFDGIFFDYILFADVLEHLQNPELVLSSAVSLLKGDGTVIASIPNIGHGDVICSLLCNRFCYTGVGLLDNTHIHFWGKTDFNEMAENTGLSVVKEDAVIKRVNSTEQAVFGRGLSEVMRKQIAQYPYANVYQFIFAMQKRNWVEANCIVRVSNIECDSHLITDLTAKFYFDTGNGYSEEESRSYSIRSDELFSERILVPKGCNRVRFDPLDGMSCCVWIPLVFCDGKRMSLSSINGIKIGDIFLFLTTDPQIELNNIPDNSNWIEISYLTFPVEATVWTELYNTVKEKQDNYAAIITELEKEKDDCLTLFQAFNRTETERRNLLEKLTLAEAEQVNLTECLSKAEAERDSLNECLEQCNQEKSLLEEEKTNATAQCEKLKRQLSDIQYAYDAILNATCWKITKPLRMVLIAIKKMIGYLKNSITWQHVEQENQPSDMTDVEKNCEYELPSEVTDVEIVSDYKPPLELYQQLNGKTVDIIVPIYNGKELLKPLLESIPRTEMPYHLFLIDDKSPDQEILPMLHDYADRMGNVTVIENQENLGYTCSINKGFKLSEGHVVLLNTDVRLPMYWLERLMTPILMDTGVASVTPFTNSGTICSFPRFLENNELYLGLSVDEIDAVFRRFKPQYTQIPTGVGFCMAISRDALSVVGEYDENSFPRGYGEENDWCQRAIKDGFKNVMAENLFVYHQHGATFTTEEKQKLISLHSQRLNQMHPNYDADVHRFIGADPIKEYRIIAQMLLYRPGTEKAPILAFNHSWGGGSAYYLDEKIKTLTSSGQDFLTIQYLDGKYKLSRFFEEDNLSICRKSLDELFRFLPERLSEVWVNELVSYPNIDQVLEQIKALSYKKSAKLIFRIHDFYCICPSFKLLDDNDDFCGVPGLNECHKHCPQFGYIERWRKMWGEFLKKCDEITAFSNDSEKILKRVYPELKQVTVVPHVVKELREVSPHAKGPWLTIGVIGAIDGAKGRKILEQMAEIIYRGGGGGACRSGLSVILTMSPNTRILSPVPGSTKGISFLILSRKTGLISF